MKIWRQPIGAAPPPGRLWPRWLALALVVIGLVVAFVNLGQWQLNRLEQRRERNQAVTTHEAAAVIDYQLAFAEPITETGQWQRVRATGQYDSEHQFLALYRANGGASQGYEVITPLRTTAGEVLLVSRGWAERLADGSYPSTAPAAPTGEVTVIGYTRRDEQGSAAAITPADSQVRLINSVAIGEALGESVLGGYLGLIESTPAQAAGLSVVAPPELTEGNHLSYAVQWFTFSAIAAVGLVLIIRSDLRQRKTAAARNQETP